MKYILEVTKNIQFRQHKENKEKERGKNVIIRNLHHSKLKDIVKR